MSVMMDSMLFVKKRYYHTRVTSRKINWVVESSVKMGFLFCLFSLSKRDPGFLIFLMVQTILWSQDIWQKYLEECEISLVVPEHSILLHSFSAEELLLYASKTPSPSSVIPHNTCCWHCLFHSCFPHYSWSYERVRAMCTFQNSDH